MSDLIKVNKFTKEIKKKKRLNAVKLDREEEHLNREKILAEGQDNREKGIKAVQAAQKELKQEKDKFDADYLTDLESKKRWHDSYKKTLASALGKLLESLDWIVGWQAYCLATSGNTITIKGKPFATKDGILLIVTTPDGRVLHQGILSTGDPLMDYSALYTIAAQVENTMDQERHVLLDRKPEEVKTDTILDQYGKPIKAD
jgi:hypothetical protein